MRLSGDKFLVLGTELMDLSFHLAIQQKGWLLPCTFCGKLMKEGEPDLEIDKQYVEETSFLLLRVWHNNCHEQFWDLGEQ
jgi:hypothetical protein